MRAAAQPDTRAAWDWRLGALVFGLALVPRLAHLWFVWNTPLASEFVPDLTPYLDFTSRLMHGTFFFAMPMHMSPGYAFVLAPLYILFGPDPQVLVLANAVLDAGSAALCAGLAARLSGRLAPSGRQRAAGLWAGLLYACCGELLLYALLPLSEGPSIFCLLAGMTLLFGSEGGAGQAPGLRPWLAGAVLALAGLVRPNLFPALLLGLAAWTLLGPRDTRGLRHAAVARVVLALLLALAPFMAHNLVLEGRATPFGFQGGLALYTGNHPGGSGGSDDMPGFGDTPGRLVFDAWAEAQRRTGRELTLSQADAHWLGEALRFFREEPGDAARLLGRKVLLLVHPGGLDGTMDLHFSARFSPVPGLLALPLGLVFALAAAGLWRCARSSSEALALAMLLLGLAATLVLFVVTPRFRAPWIPLALCFAGAFLAELPDLLRAQRRRLLGPALCFALVLSASLAPTGGQSDAPARLAQEHVRLAGYYFLKGQQPLAQQELVAALALGVPPSERLKALLVSSLALQGQAPPRPAP